MTADHHTIRFIPSGRGKAQCAPDPAYPEGIDLDMALGKPSCSVALPYPAPECGLFHVVCNLCGFSAAITAAGRPDDPKSALLPCILAQKPAD